MTAPAKPTIDEQIAFMSCGVGSMPLEECERIAIEVAETLRNYKRITEAAGRPEPVARVKRNSGCNGREFIGETLEFKDLPVGAKLYAVPPSNSVTVPRDIFDGALNYIKHVGSNFTERGEPHPQQWIVDGLNAAKKVNQPPENVTYPLIDNWDGTHL